VTATVDSEIVTMERCGALLVLLLLMSVTAALEGPNVCTRQETYVEYKKRNRVASGRLSQRPDSKSLQWYL
jgi:hypothetical protein